MNKNAIITKLTDGTLDGALLSLYGEAMTERRERLISLTEKSAPYL